MYICFFFYCKSMYFVNIYIFEWIGRGTDILSSVYIYIYICALSVYIIYMFFINIYSDQLSLLINSFSLSRFTHKDLKLLKLMELEKDLVFTVCHESVDVLYLIYYCKHKIFSVDCCMMHYT